MPGIQLYLWVWITLFLISILGVTGQGVTGRPNEAMPSSALYKELESVSSRSPNFLETFEELQKLHYADGYWNRFFGYAIFYRQNYLATKEAFRQNFRQRPIALEIMALGKHCQWERARVIAIRSLEWAKQLSFPKAATDEVQGAFDHVNLLSQYPDLKVAPHDTDAPQIVFDSKALWSIPVKDVGRIHHPKNLRVHVKNLCPVKTGEAK